MIRVAITGGGTGGHLYPALAVAEMLQKDSEIEALLYLGNAHRQESTIIPQHGIAFVGLLFSGLPRKISLRLFLWLFEFWTAFWNARSALTKFCPHVLFATGGYITGPVILAALSLGVPCILHEPDANPGLVNRVFSRWATAATCAFPAAQSILKAKSVYVTGNPLRGDIGHVSSQEALARLALPFDLNHPILLVIGGSLGARKINQALLSALPELINQHKLQILHQTGEKLFEEVKLACPKEFQDHPAYQVRAFITDMGSTLSLATLAVARAGSMSLSEFYQASVPTILVPYPLAAQDHQTQNALASQQAGASIMVADKDLSPEKLVETIISVLQTPGTLDTMKSAAHKLSKPDATQTIVTILKDKAKQP